MKFPNKKGHNTGGNKYAMPAHTNLLPKPEIEYGRLIVNVDKEVLKQINELVFKQQQEGVKLIDEKMGRPMKINLSLWVRKVLKDALENETKDTL